MIRHLLATAVVGVLIAFAPATGSAQSHEGMKDHHGKSAWKELDAFHSVMAAAWHPAQEKGDLAPARARATELLAKAEAWEASSAPAGCVKPETKAKLAKLVVNAKRVVELVEKKGSDDALKSSVKVLHDDFEAGLESSCSAGGHDAKHR